MLHSPSNSDLCPDETNARYICPSRSEKESRPSRKIVVTRLICIETNFCIYRHELNSWSWLFCYIRGNQCPQNAVKFSSNAVRFAHTLTWATCGYFSMSLRIGVTPSNFLLLRTSRHLKEQSFLRHAFATVLCFKFVC